MPWPNLSIVQLFIKSVCFSYFEQEKRLKEKAARREANQKQKEVCGAQSHLKSCNIWLDINDECWLFMWIKVLKQFWHFQRFIKWFLIWKEEFLSQGVRGERCPSVSGLSLPQTAHNSLAGSCHVSRLSACPHWGIELCTSIWKCSCCSPLVCHLINAADCPRMRDYSSPP